MTQLTGWQVKERLCDAVARAAEARFERAEKAVIPADLIRRLALCRPLGREREARTLTPFGIRIVGARIDGRLALDKATPPEGGPLCPLEFHDCVLDGGFSGAHARFSRLGFRKCRFRDAPPDADGHVPSLNLAGASIGTDLDLRGVKPASARDHLWIRAAGAWIDGEVDLSCSVLKAPPGRSGQLLSEASCDALDLSLTELRGDFQFLNGAKCSGRVNMRGVHITGDIWMSGAHLEVSKGKCLFLQSATIGGNLILDGRAAKFDKSGDIERFEAVGQIDLVEIKLGGSLDINDADLRPGEADADPLLSDGGVCVCLIGARIGGPVTIGSKEVEELGSKRVEKSRIKGRLVLDGMEVASSLTLKNAQIGLKTGDPDGPATLSARSLVARRVEVKGIEPLLWSDTGKAELNPRPRMLSVNLDGARVERLKIHASRFSGHFRARPLTCARDVTLDVWVGGEVDLKGSDVGGSLDISDLRVDGGLGLRDAGIGRALKFNRPPGPHGRLEELVKARVTELTCLPETILIETLWRYQSGPDKALVCQVAFLKKRRLIRPLDKPEALDVFVKAHGHAVRSPAAAEEYVRLMAAYAGKAEDRAWVVPRPGLRPPFLQADPAAPEPDAVPAAAAAGPAPAAAPAPADTAVTAPDSVLGTAQADTAPGPAPDTVLDTAQADTAPGVAAAQTAPGGAPAETGPREALARAAPAAALVETASAKAPEAVPAAQGAPPAAPGAGALPDPADSLDALAPERFALRRERVEKEGLKYVVRGCFLHGNRLMRSSFEVTPAKDRVTVVPTFGKLVGPPLKNMPIARDLYTYHPGVQDNQAELWVVPPVLNEDRDQKRPDLASFQTLLLPYVQPGSSIRGEVDLTDLSCDTLDDGGGRFWGKDLKFHLDRFVYRQATWAEDLPDAGFRDWVRRHVSRLIAERSWPSLIAPPGWREARLQREDFWAPWQIRRNWIYQQFKLEPDLSSPTRHRIQQSEYRSQPFEQAIRVARQEGREDFAVQFEILKRRIEWSLFSRRSRWPLLLVGSLAGMAWIVATGGPRPATGIALAGLIALIAIVTRPRSGRHWTFSGVVQPVLAALVFFGTLWWLVWVDWGIWERPRNFVVAVLLLVMLRYMSVASDWLMRNLFGYLRLPINAISSLIAAFLLGWAAVDLANDRQMLVIDVEPVASLVARDNEQRVYVGTPRGTAGARKVHCGDEIDEALYALDVLIPLIDLRQEIRCQVGRAIPLDDAQPGEGRKLLAYVVEWLLGPILDSEAFWSAAKAFYAIAGWFLVSLSILTFANANRPRGEPGG